MSGRFGGPFCFVMSGRFGGPFCFWGAVTLLHGPQNNSKRALLLLE
jgi:hypothetical protein